MPVSGNPLSAAAATPSAVSNNDNLGSQKNFSFQDQFQFQNRCQPYHPTYQPVQSQFQSTCQAQNQFKKAHHPVQSQFHPVQNAFQSMHPVQRQHQHPIQNQFQTQMPACQNIPDQNLFQSPVNCPIVNANPVQNNANRFPQSQSESQSECSDMPPLHPV